MISGRLLPNSSNEDANKTHQDINQREKYSQKNKYEKKESEGEVEIKKYTYAHIFSLI